MQSSSRITKQASPKNTANRFLFTLLVATVVFPLPAMTPALLSGAESALSVVTAPRAELSRFVPVYFMPTKFGRRPTAMVPDTVLLGMTEPTTIINEIGADRALAFDELSPMPVAQSFDRPALPRIWPIGRPGVGGGGSIEFPSSVPEPATWAMLISGFVLAGAFLRRRRGAMLAAAR